MGKSIRWMVDYVLSQVIKDRCSKCGYKKINNSCSWCAKCEWLGVCEDAVLDVRMRRLKLHVKITTHIEI